MSTRRPFGLETEYAVTAVTTDGTVLPAMDLGGAILRAAARTMPSLPGTWDAGVFLGNGSRLYVDAGAHPEVAGPECFDPWDAVRYLRAGDRALLRLADDVRRRNPHLAEARLFTANVDYSGSGATWGSHESYAHRTAPVALRRQLVPHLVSRVVFSGAGGFNPLSAGLEFTLSPRAHHLNHVVSEATTHDRGITNTRAEPLAARGYHRQHLICGESLRSDLAAWLRVGTTALVVAIIEGGVSCSEEVELAAPIEALRTVAGDPACERRLRLKRGGTITAVQIQRHYLAQVRAHAREPFMPEWADAVCERWEAVLDRLVEGPAQVSRCLDWAIKLAIYRDHVRRRGFAWESLLEWTRLIDAIDRIRRAGPAPAPALTAALLEDDARLRSEAEKLAPTLRDANGTWATLDAVLALRRELFEVDNRWGLLGPGGLFDEIDKAGVLDHRVRGVDGIDEAVEQPPREGRAGVRGKVIQRVWLGRANYSCGWEHVSDFHARLRLDLSDPLTNVEIWRPSFGRREAEPPPSRPGEPDAASDGGSVLEDLQRMLGRVRSRPRRTPPADAADRET